MTDGTRQHGPEARKLLARFFGLPVMVALEPLLEHLYVQLQTSGKILHADIEIPDSLDSDTQASIALLQSSGWALCENDDDHWRLSWWNNDQKHSNIIFGPAKLMQKNLHAIPGTIFHCRDTGETYIMTMAEQWVRLAGP